MSPSSNPYTLVPGPYSPGSVSPGATALQEHFLGSPSSWATSQGDSLWSSEDWELALPVEENFPACDPAIVMDNYSFLALPGSGPTPPATTPADRTMTELRVCTHRSPKYALQDSRDQRHLRGLTQGLRAGIGKGPVRRHRVLDQVNVAAVPLRPLLKEASEFFALSSGHFETLVTPSGMKKVHSLRQMNSVSAAALLKFYQLFILWLHRQILDKSRPIIGLGVMESDNLIIGTPCDLTLYLYWIYMAFWQSLWRLMSDFIHLIKWILEQAIWNSGIGLCHSLCDIFELSHIIANVHDTTLICWWPALRLVEQWWTVMPYWWYVKFILMMFFNVDYLG